MRQVYRTGGQQIAVVSQAAPDGSWGQPVLSAGPGGHGQVTACLDGEVIRLYTRDAAGAVSTALLDDTGAVGAWASLGGATDVPAVALDGLGEVRLFTADAAGQVSIWSLAGDWFDLT